MGVEESADIVFPPGLLANSRIFFPTNRAEHWALVVADIVDGTVHFTFYDSWEPSRRSAGPSHIADVRLYLERYMNRLPEEQRLTLRYSW